MTASADIVALRTRLMERYREAFGCQWDVTPWGERWQDLLQTARAADEEHHRAVNVLTELQASLARVKALAEEYGTIPADQPIREAMVGRTLADALVVVLVAEHEGTLSQLAGDVDVSLHRLTSPFPVDTQLLEQGLDSDELKELLVGVEDSILNAPDQPPVAEYLRSFRANWNRRLRNTDGRVAGADAAVANLTEPRVMGPPSASLELVRWRRAYVVELLDAFPMRSRTQTGEWDVPTDGDIAIVSLLSGVLDEWENAARMTGAVAGIAQVLRTEQNEVALVRRRRAQLVCLDQEAE